MLTKFHKILIGALVLQLVLVVVMFMRGDDKSALREVALVPGFDAAKVTRVQVFAKDKPGVAIDLVKKDSAWRVASSFDYPADPVKLTNLLSPIAKMTAAAPIATQQARHAQLHVGDAEFDRKLVITADGKDTTLYIGSPAGPRRNAVRIDSGTDVYAVSGVSAYLASTEPREWIAPSYVAVPKDDVTKITIAHGGSTTEVVRDGETWKVSIDGTPLTATAPDTIDTQAIDDMVAAATTIDATAPADPKRAAPSPAATITIEHKAATTKPDVVDIDIAADETSYWVHSRALDRAVTVDKPRLDRALTVTRDKLIKKPAAKPAGAGSNAPQDLTMPPMPPE